jgi:hypothetical protein
MPPFFFFFFFFFLPLIFAIDTPPALIGRHACQIAADDVIASMTRAAETPPMRSAHRQRKARARVKRDFI